MKKGTAHAFGVGSPFFANRKLPDELVVPKGFCYAQNKISEGSENPCKNDRKKSVGLKNLEKKHPTAISMAVGHLM